MNLRPAVLELVVADMPGTLAFYRLLGFAIPELPPTKNRMSKPLSETSSWPSTRSRRSAPSTRSGRRPPGDRVALAFECDSPAEVDAAWKEITTAGYHGHLEPWDAVGTRYAVVHDPDGTPVDLFASLPETA